MKTTVTIFSFVSIFLLNPFSVISQTAFNDVNKTPKIDGKIDDNEWAGAKIFTDFHIFIPKTDEKFYDSTVAYVKQTKDAMCFAFKYWPRGKVISKSLIRDRSTEDENEFFILLDLENKNKNGYIFAFSFLNNQRDQLVYNVRNQSHEWDWVWEVQSKIFKESKNGEAGYIETEVRIPVDKLQNKNKKQIGFDLQLFSYKPDGNYYYYSPNPGSELLSMESTLKYDLIQPFDEKINLTFNATPYIVGRKFNNEEYGASLGGEFNASLDKHKLKGTYNTDEATLEADPFRFSFYNRPIFLQEKRLFLSKDLDIYRTNINLFYTREIDSIDYGLNYTYRSDALKAGFLYIEDEKDEATGNNKSYFVARPNYTYKDLSFGSLFIYTKDDDLAHQERILSFDAFYRFPTNPLRLGGQYASDFTGYNTRVFGFWQFNNSGGPYADFAYGRVSKDFNSSTYFNFDIPSFVRNNYDELFLSGGYNFNYNRKLFSDLNFNAAYYKSQTLDEDNPFGVDFIMQERYSANANIKVNDFIRANFYGELNRPNDFDETGSLIKRTNTLSDVNATFFLGNNSFNIGYFSGPYYGSFIKNPYASWNLFFFERVGLIGSINFIEQFGEKITLFNNRVDLRILDDLYVRSFFQRDNSSKRALWNTLLQYEFFAGSSVYFVMNLEGRHLENTRRFFKVGYEFNF